MAAYDPPPTFTYRIAKEAGTGFSIGALASTPYHFYKGIASMPRGSRITGGLQNIRMRSPATAGSWAVWCSLFGASECAAAHLRAKEDPWNTIIGGAAASGILTLRKGPGPTVRAALFTGWLIGLVEGVQIVMANRFKSTAQGVPVQIVQQEPAGALPDDLRLFLSSTQLSINEKQN
ncbi:mitochondrial import inner membrane translocase subunit TIM17-1-like [Spinacia oleracea]|uniref:Mitochondrial import inner membrane translocase subunit TIM17-1-like n=1 Tax=Spinacia oleracea TaxID=3562 RepID=A0A9R0JI29_SPIOL|nr:mitochondrial import inner membrane translocase subunit TIM17-1-like [Spinacia oleracea]